MKKLNAQFMGLFMMLGLIMSSGCANVSTLQTARTLAPDESEITIGAGYATLSATSTGTDISFSAPYFEGYYKAGLAENLDFGVKLTLIGTLSADVKYQLVDVDAFALAVGAGLGYVTINSASIIDILLPIYVSYDFSDMFALYGSPKYLLRTGGGSSSLLGSSLGVKWGKTSGVYLEGSYMSVLGESASASQGNIGVFFR